MRINKNEDYFKLKLMIVYFVIAVKFGNTKGKTLSEFQLNRNNQEDAYKWITNLLNEGPYYILTAKNPAIGKWSMTRLWRSWMDSTAKEMAKRGVNMLIVNGEDKCIGERQFNADDAHELFSTTYLSDNNGKRLSWSRKGRDGMRQATRGERVHAMEQHQHFMINRGIKHLNPNDSDYKKALQEQNK